MVLNACLLLASLLLIAAMGGRGAEDGLQLAQPECLPHRVPEEGLHQTAAHGRQTQESPSEKVSLDFCF